MDFFELKSGETIEVAGIPARCIFCTPRSTSFEIARHDGDGYRQMGWFDIHWIGGIDDGLVHLRFALRPSVATIRFTNQIRDDLYARLGMPPRVHFKQYVINFDQTVEVHDDRGCILCGQIVWDGDPPDLTMLPLFEPPFLPETAKDRMN